jgi:hypothetical protein
MKIDANKVRERLSSWKTKLDAFLSSRTAESVVRVFVIVTMISCFVVFARQDQFSACQSRYDQAYAIYAQNTREINAETNRLRDEWLKAFSEALKRKDQRTLEDIDEASVKYFQGLEKARKQQDLTPPPPLPEDTCGKH